MYHMDGQKPSGFKSSSFEGMIPSNMPPMDPPSPNMPDPWLDNSDNSDSPEIQIRSLKDVFAVSTSIQMFF